MTWLRRGDGGEAGFTMVEMIVTIAVGGLVIAAVFPIFLLLNRVERTWSDNAQARATGLLAEQALEQDLRSYAVVGIGKQTLVLQGAVHPGQSVPQGSTFCISYSVKTDSSPSRLIREVSWPGGRVISSSTVAHGVSSFESNRVPGSSAIPAIKVNLILTSAGDLGLSVPVVPDPPLVVMPRTDTTDSKSVCS